MNHMALHDQSALPGVWALFCRIPMKPFRPTVLRRLLPNTRHTVTVEPCVGRDERKILDLRLDDQQAVEGIAMMPGQCLDLADMIEIDGELDKAIGR